VARDIAQYMVTFGVGFVCIFGESTDGTN
jgi:hypothetical protein